jgi:hypothetical protein
VVHLSVDRAGQEAARTLVESVAAELHIEPDMNLVELVDAETAMQLRFLGSPTIRVNGRDVEPRRRARGDFVVACRVYQTERGVSGQPHPGWVRKALAEAAA